MKDTVVETNLLKYYCEAIFGLMLAGIWRGLFSGVIFARFPREQLLMLACICRYLYLMGHGRI
jgi:hypothetical protein